MTYIKLEDVLHRIYAEPNTSDKLYQDINSLPTINPEAMIIAEIEKRKNYSYTADRLWDRARFVVEIEINILEELLQKFKS